MITLPDELGKKGEEIAVAYLKNEGYQITELALRPQGDRYHCQIR